MNDPLFSESKQGPCVDKFCKELPTSVLDAKNAKKQTLVWMAAIHVYDLNYSGAPNDSFLPNALKRCFRLSGVLLKLCRLILGCAIKFLSVRFF